MKDRAETFGNAAFRAAQGGDLGEVLALLKNGANPDVPDRHGFTALTRAAQFDHLDLLRVLLFAGADPNIANKWGRTPLMAAKSADAAEELLEAGATLNAVTLADGGGWREGETALMRAVASGYLPVVRVLLAHGADLEMRDTENRNALIFAATNDHGDVVQELLASGATVGLVEAATLGDVVRVQDFLRVGADLHRDLMARALWRAAGRGQAEVIRLLLVSGADVDARGRSAVTALMQAAMMGRTEVARLLLDYGAAVNAWDSRGATALHASLVSTHGRNPDVVRALLTAGAEVNARTRFSWPTHTGGTALMEAALHGATDCAGALIEFGADLEAVSDIDEDGVGGWTALLAAVANNRLDTTRLLIERGADVNNGGKDGRLPLTIARSRASRAGSTEIVDLLVTAGADGRGNAA